VQLSTLLSIKTGGCPEDCGYCPQAARHHTDVASESLLDVAQVSDISAVVSPDTFVRPTYAGNVLTTVQSKDPIKVITVRITGCPNGCARPYLAEIALIGRAPGRYTLRLGGDAIGQRLNVIFRDNIDEPAILAVLDELFGRYRAERQVGERFGDFLWRVKVLTTQKIS